jgi:hypothetical protein
MDAKCNTRPPADVKCAWIQVRSLDAARGTHLGSEEQCCTSVLQAHNVQSS